MEPSVQREERERRRSLSSKIECSRNKRYERERSQRLGGEKNECVLLRKRNKTRHETSGTINKTCTLQHTLHFVRARNVD